ncbi:MAG: MATE family efflux transporter [Polyangiales bacterium]
MLNDMTQGSVRGHVVRMTLFMLAGFLIQTLYSLVDIYWVGRLGQHAVAAVALSTNLMFVSLALTQSLSVGCVALVSQAAGRKDEKEVQRLFNQAQSLSMFAGVFFLVVALASMRVYAEKLSGDAETARLSREFLVWFIPALGLQFTMVALASALRGIGDMKPGLIAQLASVVGNMVLAPFLIFGWVTGKPLGVAGAALSTFIATLGAVVGLSLYLARAGTYLRLRLSLLRPDFGTWRKMVAIGVPSGAEFLLMSVTMGFVYAMVKPFGSQSQAGFGIGSRVFQAGIMPAVAMSFAVAAVVGQNFGSRHYDRVRAIFREAAKLITILMLCFIVVSQLAASALVRPFSGDPVVIDVASGYVRTVSFVYVASGLVMVCAGVFQGIGNTWPSLVASAVRVVSFVGIVLFLSHRADFTLRSIWITSVATVVLQVVIALWLLRTLLRAFEEPRRHADGERDPAALVR